MRSYTIVGNTHSHPHGAFRCTPLPYHFKNPHLFGIGNRKTLTTAVIAVFLHQVGHHGYCLPCRSCPLQSQLHETAVIDDSRRIDQFGTAAKCRLGDRKLVFVHKSYHFIGMLDLRNFSQRLIRIAIPYFYLTAFGVIGSRSKRKRTIQGMRIGRIGYESRTVDGCLATGQKAGTCINGRNDK